MPNIVRRNSIAWCCLTCPAGWISVSRPLRVSSYYFMRRKDLWAYRVPVLSLVLGLAHLISDSVSSYHRNYAASDRLARTEWERWTFSSAPLHSRTCMQKDIRAAYRVPFLP